jgi:hypothetical protein
MCARCARPDFHLSKESQVREVSKKKAVINSRESRKLSRKERQS